MAVVAAASTLVGLGTAAAPAAAAGTGTVGVYVGYADAFHTVPRNFPAPWAGSQNVIFEGCRPVGNCAYDGGAVRITNETNAAITVNSITVHIDTCAYSGWPVQTLAPESQLIVTQLTSGPANGCTGPVPDHMDTSDVGPGGQSYSGNRAKNGIVPTVDVTINGTTTTYTDLGQVLNTGGFDVGGCPAGTNESHPWAQLQSTYVALGDSFSSGEGVPPYFVPTNTAANQCHRSTRAYPVIVAKTLGYYGDGIANFGDHPCSGAVVADVWGTAGAGAGTIGGIGQWNEQPQITNVDKRTGLVTLSIGGNDVGFGTMLKSCVAAGMITEVNGQIASVNTNVIGRVNTAIGHVNKVTGYANTLNRLNPFWTDIPPIPLVPLVTPLANPPCLGNLPGMLNLLANGGAETICRTGNVPSDPMPGTVGCPGGAVTYNFNAPSLTQLYLQIAQQAAPGAKIQVMAYPPIVNPAGVSNVCSVNVRGSLTTTASATVNPFTVLPALSSLPAFLAARIPATISRSTNRTDHLNVDVPALTTTAVANLNVAATQLNGVIAASVAGAAATDPNIVLVSPYAQFAPPVNGGLGGWFCNNAGTTNILGGPTTTSPFFNQGLMLPSTLTITSLNLATPTVGFTFGGADPGSVHPNATGHRALACAFLGQTVAQCGL